MGHDEPVPAYDILKEPMDIHYIPMHAAWKESSTSTKIRVVFDTLPKTELGKPLNDKLMMGPNVSMPLFDTLLRFR